jgi:hypothetical protein
MALRNREQLIVRVVIATSQVLGVHEDDILGTSKAHKISRARQIAIMACHTKRIHRDSIAKAFDRCPSTVIKAIRLVKSQLAAEQTFGTQTLHNEMKQILDKVNLWVEEDDGVLGKVVEAMGKAILVERTSRYARGPIEPAGKD